MKTTGMSRPLDSLGRIVIPKEIRLTMGIYAGDSLEFFVDPEACLLSVSKYNGVSCKMCNSIEELTYFKNSFLCKNCIQELKENNSDYKIPIPVVRKTISKEKRPSIPLDQQLEKLRELIRENPNAKQNEYAQQLEVSQSRISMLKKLL
ncbi:AbrB/MazE/SpoVT family DNA-binding domain-containing protein [Paenibacillus polymyxa]|uniref:AbrB/MazE/SpoVT family DNA-binding domain-containing protein n=1 Tax=Paenibacillus polymyxa TaxID=1406 RepID=UPI003217D280